MPLKEGRTIITNDISGIGTGPYEFVEWEHGAAVKFKRFDDYWGWNQLWDKLPPEYFVYKIITEPQTHLAQLIGKEVDWSMNVPAESEEVILRTKGLVSKSLTTSAYVTIYGAGKKDTKGEYPLATGMRGYYNRRALTAVIDRNKINEVVFNGEGRVATNWYPYDQLSDTSDIHTPNSDVELAKEFLAKAGNPEGFSATIITLQGRGFDKYFPSIQEDAKKVGIDLKLQLIPTATLVSYGESGVSPAWIHDNEFAVGDFLYQAERYFYGGYEKWTPEIANTFPELVKEIDSLFAAAKIQPIGSPERLRTAQEVHRIWGEMCMTIPIVFPPWVVAHWDYINDLKIDSELKSMFENIYFVDSENGPPSRNPARYGF
jgi:ABC-type transport system substrate-binding protein